MRKTNVVLIIALALLTGAVSIQTSPASAQGNQPVGVVVGYVPGQSITIADQSGTQHEYLISTSVEILPPGRANTLAVGSFVTIIAPASLDKNKQTAVGIVVHPQVPGGWSIPSLSATPFATGTPNGSETATSTGTLATGTVTATLTETPTAVSIGTQTETPTPFGTLTDTPTPTPTPAGGSTTVTTNTFIEWLKSLFRQVISSQ